MWRPGLLAVLITAIPSLVSAQEGPERLLPPNTQIFFRWDGFDTHRPAYEKTALGKMMKGETGTFLTALWSWAAEAAETTVAQHDPQAAEMIKDGLATLASIGKNGLTISVAAKSFMPPQGQATLVFPKSAGVMIPLANKIVGTSGAPVQETKVGNRAVHHVNTPFVNFGYWSEGDDAVFMVGSDDPTDYARRIDAKETGLASNPVYKQVAAFKEFTVWSRGYLDVAALTKLGGDVSPDVSRLIEDLGLRSVKSATFVGGFDGGVERGIAEIDIPGPRKGLLALLGTKKIKLDDLPPLPDDVTGFSASNFNAGQVYDTGIQVVEAVVRIFAPEQADNVREGINQVEGFLGVKLGADLFGSFDDMWVAYGSPSEGPPFLGKVYLFKVKNEKKLQESLGKLIGVIPQLPGIPVEMKKRSYHGVEVNTLQVNVPGQISALSFATHKGWFVVGNYPQGVYGFILRAKGELPAWKANAELTKALAAFPKEFTSVSVTDPRPMVRTVLSLAPPAIAFANGFTSMAPNLRPFDVGLVPHPQEATRHLFPNITVTTDDGKKIRYETRASLALPF
jgi:hypothetical protein